MVAGICGRVTVDICKAQCACLLLDIFCLGPAGHWEAQASDLEFRDLTSKTKGERETFDIQPPSFDR